MKPLCHILLAVLACCGWADLARGQDPAQPTPPPLPPGPLIQKRAANMAAWSVTMSDNPHHASGKQAAPAPSPRGSQDKDRPPDTKITVVKTGDIRVIQHVDQNDHAWNVWCLGKLQVMAWSDGKSCAVLSPPPNKDVNNPFYTDFAASDFQGFEWLSLENYTAIETFAGRSCIVFKAFLSIPSEPPSPPTHIPAVAYVDLDSRLPISLQCGEQVYTFEWKSPPASKLTLPPMIQALLNQQQQAINQLSKKAVKPF